MTWIHTLSLRTHKRFLPFFSFTCTLLSPPRFTIFRLSVLFFLTFLHVLLLNTEKKIISSLVWTIDVLCIYMLHKVNTQRANEREGTKKRIKIQETIHNFLLSRKCFDTNCHFNTENLHIFFYLELSFWVWSQNDFTWNACQGEILLLLALT